MARPSDFGKDTNFAVVVGGHKDDPASDQSGTCRIIDPARHGDNFSPTDMRFVTKLVNPTQGSLEETHFSPEPGTIVGYTGDVGSQQKCVIGTVADVPQLQSEGGNNPLLKHINWAMSQTTGKNRPTKWQTKMERGAEVRSIEQEMGEWMNNLVKGLPSNGIIPPLVGQFLPQIKQIETAIQQFAQIPSLSMLAGMPGKAMNLGDVFKKMTPKQKKKIEETLPPEIIMALNSLIALMQEGNGALGNVTSGRVHEETFMNNVIEMLKGITTIAELVSVLTRLKTDTTLHGLDKLEEILIYANTVYGNVVMTMDHTGELKMDANNQAKIDNAISSLAGVMNSAIAGDQGKSLFDKAAKTMSEMFGRIPNNIRKELVEKVVQNAKKNKHDTGHNLTRDGGNPLTIFSQLG